MPTYGLYLSTLVHEFIGIYVRKLSKMIGNPFTIEPYAVGIRENESNLRDEVNFAIQKMVKTGYYDAIYMKWFGVKPTVKPELWP